MTTKAEAMGVLSLDLAHEIEISAPVETTFDSILELMGPSNMDPTGRDMPMVLEPWVGGRWFRDLGAGDGHLWGHVQVLLRPRLIEVSGPLFMSYPAVSHVRYRLEPDGESGTRLSFRHRALGFLDPDHREGVKLGWVFVLDRVTKHAQASAGSR